MRWYYVLNFGLNIFVNFINIFFISVRNDDPKKKKNKTIKNFYKYFLIPAAYAAKHFSLIPPTGSTNPFKEISPVIENSDLTFLSVNKETYFIFAIYMKIYKNVSILTIAVTIVIPALGPSLGLAAAGKCILISMKSNILRLAFFPFSFSLSGKNF